MNMPPGGELVWVCLRQGEGFWYLGQVSGGQWWVPGAGLKHPASVHAWRPFS